MRTKLFKIAQAATFGLAIAFTFSCSSGGDDPDNGNGGSNSSLIGTNGTLTDTRDKKPYKWVKIGEQYWMAENLNYSADGSKCYGDDPANCAKYGRLYNWATAMTVCPIGWHLPSDAEWGILMQFVNPNCLPTTDDNCPNAGKFLKATIGWNDYDGQSGNGEDKYSFAALPGGSHFDGNFSGISEVGYWWSASEYDVDRALHRRMNNDRESAKWDAHDKSYLFSVRCLQD
jgi:uncharacterized protein (TIGR02145 family)